MAYNFKETMSKPERLAPGHRMCAGCGGTIAVRNVLRGLHEGDHAVVANATGCLEVSTFMYPYTAWEDSYIHNAFENAAATCSGAVAAYEALKKRGRLEGTTKFLAVGGDGGTYDIGFQSLSGAMER
ncbi:MAG: pyruvate ferredoxin oxidoreductase, partial [Oscillospiraceae bacterium]|nr:pyruvate ferredoxin oxidoreductase [Oscillospiraceae bacterium]